MTPPDPFLGPNHQLLGGGPPEPEAGTLERLARAASTSLGVHALVAIVVGVTMARMPVLVAPAESVLTRTVLEWAPRGSDGGDSGKTPAASEALPRATRPAARDPVTMTAAPRPALTEARTIEPPPLASVPSIALQSSALETLPGAEIGDPSALVRQPGGNRGQGPGAGIGDGDPGGIGDGRRGAGQPGGSGGWGTGVTWPRVLREVRPMYTTLAMQARIQGVVELEVMVNSDGTVGHVRVVRSLDPVFSLDREAIKAVQAWRFSPALEHGRPIAVTVPVELNFTLR